MCVFIVIHFDTNKYPYILLCDEKSPRSVHLSRHGSSVSVSATLVPYSLRGRRPVVSGIPSEYIHIYIHVYMHTYDVYARVSYVRIHVCVCVCLRIPLLLHLSLDLMPVARARAFEHDASCLLCEGRSVCSPRSPRKDNRPSTVLSDSKSRREL